MLGGTDQQEAEKEGIARSSSRHTPWTSDRADERFTIQTVSETDMRQPALDTRAREASVCAGPAPVLLSSSSSSSMRQPALAARAREASACAGPAPVLLSSSSSVRQAAQQHEEARDSHHVTGPAAPHKVCSSSGGDVMFTLPASDTGPNHNVPHFGAKIETRDVKVLKDASEGHQEQALANMLDEAYGISWTLSMREQGKEEDLQRVDITDRHYKILVIKPS